MELNDDGFFTFIRDAPETTVKLTVEALPAINLASSFMSRFLSCSAILQLAHQCSNMMMLNYCYCIAKSPPYNNLVFVFIASRSKKILWH
jgi:hypothetical protein